ncbi:hypothetical protein D0N36_10155 [Hymenobacter lapidiphilus]|uniref:hypothetical protein n=1 Tax=Hymenobacter sp. CCM 8763 TaxID=2303334 RepID=UPI000E357238|nr:hypothetical protein [Hymenobacter sp. CCM 8763]RFP65215.1 hypothetical protein D0N36_10155 [Hymenobacter sp. CCM 8763]
MKQLLLLALSLGLSAATAQAQSTEFTLHATSGYFSYRGASATGTSFINGSDTGGSGYTNNPYGNRFTLSYGGAGQVQRVTAYHLVLGAQAGYEWLRSRVAIDSFYPGRGSQLMPAMGNTLLTSRFINTHLFVGRRFELGPMNLDATVGPELALLRGVNEKGDATSNGTTIRTDRTRYTDTTDDLLRARANLTAYYQRLGLSVGYSHGLLDQKRGYVGGTNDLSSQMLRVGLAYRIN